MLDSDSDIDGVQRHVPPRPRLTAALGLLAAALVPALWWAAQPPPRVVVASWVPRLSPAEHVRFEKRHVTGARETAKRITNVQVVDFDSDGANELLVCDAARNAVLLYARAADGEWNERVLGDELKVPAHATVVDLDGDGDRDVVVSVLGDIFPSDDVVGSVVLLENRDGEFTQRVLLDDVRRVADAQPGDFDGDGDVDLAVAVFGYARGEVLWLENRGDLQFRDHQLLSRPGTIHVPVGDLDGDGDPDIAAIVTQEEEELWAFENLGRGEFKSRLLYYTDNYDVGGAGLVMCDLDRDGDQDLLLPQGDNLEDRYNFPQPYHGCLWLENRRDWDFHVTSIGRFGGTYAAAPGDLDGDGDLDVALVSMSNDFSDPNHASAVWLENDGQQHFRMRHLDTDPIYLVTVACGDVDGDGRDDVVAGALHLPPFRDDRVERLTLWLNREAGR